LAIETARTRTVPKIAGAYAFFATLYFVQSVGDPTSGLVAQPVRSLLKAWGESPAELAALMALLALPWTIKPIFGLLSDFVPLFGSRRRNYLLLANAMAAGSLLLLAFAPLSPGNRWVMFALLLPTTMAIALGDVIVDALMVERGRPLGLTGRFQSIQWAAANAVLLLTGVLGGYVAQDRLQSLAFAGCAVLWLFALVAKWFYATDKHGEHIDSASLRETGAALLDALRDPLFLAVCALLTLWSFNPVWGSVLYVHMTEDLGFSEQQFGNVTSAFFLGSLLGSIGYGIYCRSDRLSRLLHLSIIAAVISNAASRTRSSSEAAAQQKASHLPTHDMLAQRLVCFAHEFGLQHAKLDGLSRERLHALVEIGHMQPCRLERCGGGGEVPGEIEA
jgi:BT1 family